MVKVQLDEKDFAERKPYFDAGVHEVVISGIEKVEPKEGSPYINVTVTGLKDESTDIRCYISEKAAPYTLANFGRIAVHNQDSEPAKAKVRKAFQAVTDTDQLDQEFLDKLKDMQAWILVEEDFNAPKPNGGYYLRSKLYSWEPKPKKVTADDLTTDQIRNGAAPVDDDDVPFK